MNIIDMDGKSAYVMKIGREVKIMIAENIADAIDKASSISDEYEMVYHKSIDVIKEDKSLLSKNCGIWQSDECDCGEICEFGKNDGH